MPGGAENNSKEPVRTADLQAEISTPGRPEYDAGVLTAGERHLVIRTGCVGNVLHMAETRNAYNILVTKPEWNRPLRRHRRGWENKIKINVKYEATEWIQMAQNRGQ
jgi:hypothetical protein